MKLGTLMLVLAMAILAAPVEAARESTYLSIENANPVSLEVTAEGRGENLLLGRVPANSTKVFLLKRGDYKVTGTTRYGDEQTQTIHVNRRGNKLRFERQAGGAQLDGRHDHSETWYRKWGTGDWNWRFNKSQ
jgi:hypothetical protein